MTERRPSVATALQLGILALIFAVFFASCAASSSQAPKLPANSPIKAWVGMSLEDLRSVYTDLVPDPEAAGRYVRSANEFGVAGTWTYSFTQDKLRWFVFNAPQSNIDQSTFNAYLDSTDSIVQAYTQTLGRPERVRDGIRNFNDPQVKPHDGYLVEQVTWQTAQGRVRVDYSFLGENRRYELLLSVQVSG